MITDLKDLQHVLKLCRKYGVADLEFGNIKLKLGELPRKNDEIAEEVEPQLDGGDKYILEQLGLSP